MVACLFLESEGVSVAIVRWFLPLDVASGRLDVASGNRAVVLAGEGPSFRGGRLRGNHAVFVASA